MTSGKAEQWAAVIGDVLMEEDFEIVFESKEDSKTHVLTVEERLSPRRGATLLIGEDGSIAIINYAGGASLVKDALRRRGLDKLLDSSPDSWEIAWTSLPPKALRGISARQRTYIDEYKFIQFTDGSIKAFYGKDEEHVGTWNGDRWWL